MSIDTFGLVLDDLADTLSYMILYFQGEPFLNPSMLEMVEEAYLRGIYTAVSTNAHFMDDEIAQRVVASGLSRLIISIDGASQETYENYRVGGSLQKVLDATKCLVDCRKKARSHLPAIVWQYLVVRPNEHEITQVQKMAKQYGVDKLVLKTAQINSPDDPNQLIPKNPKYSRYEQDRFGVFKLKSAQADECWKMWHSCVVTWDGKIVPCCFDKDAGYSMGNIKDQSFKSIWAGAPYQKFRETLFESRRSIPMCTNCTSGAKVWA